jgi:hypothetical protein
MLQAKSTYHLVHFSQIQNISAVATARNSTTSSLTSAGACCCGDRGDGFFLIRLLGLLLLRFSSVLVSFLNGRVDPATDNGRDNADGVDYRDFVSKDGDRYDDDEHDLELATVHALCQFIK